jgi:hypothetical protein
MCHLYEDEKQQKQFMLRIYVPNPPCLSVESTEFEPILTDMLVRVLIWLFFKMSNFLIITLAYYRLINENFIFTMFNLYAKKKKNLTHQSYSF